MSSNIFTMIRNFVLNFSNICIKKSTKLLVSGILFSAWLIFAFETFLVTKLLMSGIILSTAPIFFSKLCLSVLYWFMWIKVIAAGILLSKLFTLVPGVLDYLFLTTSLSTASFNFSSLQEQFLIYQHPNHLLLLLNYWN